MNKLLDDSISHTPFGEFSYTQLENALITRLDSANEIINNAIKLKHYSWDDTIVVIDDALYKLNHIWGLVHHLSSVLDGDEIRQIQDKYQTIISNFYLNLSQNEFLFNILNQLKDDSQLTIEQKKVIDNSLLDFKLNGFYLSKMDRIKFNHVVTKLDTLTTKFAQNVLDSTEKSAIYVTLEQLDGVPSDVIKLYHQQAIQDGQDELYKISFHMSSYLPLMQYANNRILREKAYFIYTTRASELSQLEFDNTLLVQDIVRLRYEKAQILGYLDYTSLSLEKKMATNSAQILDFLTNLTDKSLPYAKNELTQLQDYAKKNYAIDNLEPWDMAYISEKLRVEAYQYSEQELKQYFPINNVLTGLFDLLNILYSIEFRLNQTIKCWHDDVVYYDIYHDNSYIGGVYFDLFSRNKKQSGAWMNSIDDRYITLSNKKNPQAYIICNFTPKNEQNNSYLSFDEVQTIFHEMGHALHHLLTKVDHYSIAGINNVEWDAVELPSQFMELFTWNYHILVKLSNHQLTNEVLPYELYSKLLNSRYYQSGLQMLRQIEFATFDLLLHNYQGQTEINYQDILKQVQNTTSLLTIPHYNRFANSFSHIFAGGYAAGYYSYKWAEVLSCDVFSQFDGIDDKAQLGMVGNKFLQTILSRGGLYSMNDNFKEFMGREPSIEALLKYSFGDVK
jgi:oligopeptidase A